MAELHITDLPEALYVDLQTRAGEHRRSVEAEAVEALRTTLHPAVTNQHLDTLFAEIERNRSLWTPPPGTPSPEDLLREDRQR